MFVVLGDVLELLFAESAVKRFEGARNLRGESRTTSNGILMNVVWMIMRRGRNDECAHLASAALFLAFFSLSLRVEFATLGDGRLYHANVLVDLPQACQVLLDAEGDGVNSAFSTQVMY